MSEGIRPVWKSLWDLENELRSAARKAIFLRRDEAKQHMDEARRHYQDALSAIKGEPPPSDHKPTIANRMDS